MHLTDLYIIEKLNTLFSSATFWLSIYLTELVRRLEGDQEHPRLWLCRKCPILAVKQFIPLCHQIRYIFYFQVQMLLIELLHYIRWICLSFLGGLLEVRFVSVHLAEAQLAPTNLIFLFPTLQEIEGVIFFFLDDSFWAYRIIVFVLLIFFMVTLLRWCYCYCTDQLPFSLAFPLRVLPSVAPTAFWLPVGTLTAASWRNFLL